MSALPYLTDDETKDIAKPLKQPAAIVRWFRANGFADCRIKPNGLPLITRTNFEAVGAGTVGKTVSDSGQTPDVAAYLKTISRHAKSRPASQKV